MCSKYEGVHPGHWRLRQRRHPQRSSCRFQNGWFSRAGLEAVWSLLEARADPSAVSRWRWHWPGSICKAHIASGSASSASREESPLPSFASQKAHEDIVGRAPHQDPVQKGNLGAPHSWGRLCGSMAGCLNDNGQSSVAAAGQGWGLNSDLRPSHPLLHFPNHADPCPTSC